MAQVPPPANQLPPEIMQPLRAMSSGKTQRKPLPLKEVPVAETDEVVVVVVTVTVLRENIRIGELELGNTAESFCAPYLVKVDVEVIVSTSVEVVESV